ncbi:MAG: protease [Bdellovibrionaceae bacterium]|nr:protease [Pseudobdellovibrionaceae bacterium]MBX3032704.1 protease [Pseudobdellovibrionaceae bacterium]
MIRFIFLSLLLAASGANAGPFKNLEDIRQNLGLAKLELGSSNRKVKVAVLDKGFFGFQKELGRSLPASTVYSPGPLPSPEDLKIDHGLRMAQMLAGLYSRDPGRSEGLELSLYNVFGYSNFKAAIDDVVRKRFDVVLYSEVWEYGGNGDGGGFINAQVNRAIRAGVLWVNAAGNFGRTTYNGSITTIGENWVRLPDQNNGLKITCRAPEKRKCPIRVVLSWNDFKNDSEAGTNKDLDVALLDDMMNVVQTSTLKQSADRKEERPGYSKYPREIIEAQIDGGTFFIKVKDASRNFTSRDRLRISVDGQGIEMARADLDENLLTPADNREAIVVGAIDSEKSSRSLRLGKPDLLAPSSVILDQGQGAEFRGSSNAAAFTAAAVALLKRRDPRLTRGGFLSQLRGFSWSEGNMSLQTLRFGPHQGGCFTEGQWQEAPPYIQQILNAGGKLVQTTAGWRIMLPYDPVLLAPGRLQRSRPDDMIVATESGLQVFSRYGMIPQGAAEVFQRPLEMGLCGRVDVTSGLMLGF